MTDDRKAKNTMRSIIANANNGFSSPLECPGLRSRRIMNVGSTKGWFRGIEMQNTKRRTPCIYHLDQIDINWLARDYFCLG
jgi:hypothetical protein